MQVKPIRLGRTSQERMLERLAQRLPSHSFVQVHGRMVIGEHVQHGLVVATQSEPGR